MNKILRILCIAPLSMLMTGCWTSIWTVAPTPEPVAPVKTVYTTTVTQPSPKQTTVQTVTVTTLNDDWSFYLDLNAVAAAFAEANSPREFEQIINSSRYMINNLDLNRDGFIDYLRVLETRQGIYHAFLIQACLAPGVFQDVATLVAERRSDLLYVEVIGDRWLYGTNYIVRPVFIKRPPMWDVFGRPNYAVWISPYYYDYWPSYYQKPKPVYLNHYQAYVSTYMSNHHYCRQCDYPSSVRNSNYTQMTQSNARHDYQEVHPDQSFEHRVNRSASSGNAVTIRNAGQLRAAANANANTNTEPKPATTTGSSRTSSASTTTTNTGSTRTSGTATTTRGTATTTTNGSTRTSGTASTSVETRVNKSGTTRTTIKTTDAAGKTTTIKRTATSTRQSSSTPARTSSTTSISTRTSGTGSTTSTSTRTSGTSSTTSTSTRTSGGSSTRR